MQRHATTMKARWHAKQPADITQADETGPKEAAQKGKPPRPRQPQRNTVSPNNNTSNVDCAALSAPTPFLFLLRSYHLSAPIKEEINEYQLSQSEGNA